MNRKPHLKKLLSMLDQRPLVVGSFTGGMNPSTQMETARKANVDLIELRFDTFPLRAGVYMMQVLPKKLKKPVLLTWRSVKEGGEKSFLSDIEPKRRLDIIQRMLPLCDLLDVEIRDPFVKQLSHLTKSKGRGLVHSVHDFKTCPKDVVLNRLAKSSVSLKGDFFKAAVMTKRKEEMHRFLTWGAQCPHPRPALVAMGDEGVVSRIVGYCFGSTLTFGHLGTEAAPGQLRADDLMRIIKNIFKPLRS